MSLLTTIGVKQLSCRSMLLVFIHGHGPYIIAVNDCHDTPISETDSAKYLAVVIDNKLRWTKQYTNVIKNCNSTLAFLKRNLPNSPYFVLKKKQCYTSLFRPKLKYACAIWDPQCINHIENLEKVQKGRPDWLLQNIKWNLAPTVSI